MCACLPIGVDVSWARAGHWRGGFVGGILAKDEADNKEANSEDKHPGEYVMVGANLPPKPRVKWG